MNNLTDSPVWFERPAAVILGHQRSGTHFLQYSLASHPLVHARGECALRHQRERGLMPIEAERRGSRQYIFGNRPGFLNLAIVMYSQVAYFESLCGPIDGLKIIHLLRNPEHVALSIARMKAAKKRLGTNFRAHYNLGDDPDRAPLTDLSGIPAIASRVAKLQADYNKVLAARGDVLTVWYEELTNNVQTNAIAEAMGNRLLDFLGLPRGPLKNSLSKTPPLTSHADIG